MCYKGNTLINLYILIQDTTTGPLAIALRPFPVLCAGRLTLAGVGDCNTAPCSLAPLSVCPMGHRAADGREGGEWGQGASSS